jgi:hypothetical protein
MLPTVASPLARIGQRDGVELVLVSVEAWPDEVVVRLRGLPNDLTERLDAGFQLALESDTRAGRRPPAQPAERIFDFEITVADDVGTEYRSRSSARGGSGRMFRADWTFAPGPPAEAGWLIVGVAGDVGFETRVELRLDADGCDHSTLA